MNPLARRLGAIADGRAGGTSPLLVILAAIGAALLAVVIATAWPAFGDEHAYWLAAQRLVAGQALYDPSAAANTPYAYWYPPVLAQVLAPFTLVIPDWLFTVIWTALLVGALWFLSGRNLLVALALVAFLPVALELRVRNVHLLIAVLTVLALRRSWVFWVPATAIKLGPGLGVAYLLAAGRRREALLVAALGASVAVLSYVLAPQAWIAFLSMASGRAAVASGGLLDVPYWMRLGAGLILAIAAGRRGGRIGEVLLVVAITIANPTLWMNAFSILVAIVPLWRSEVPVREADNAATPESGILETTGP